MSILNTLFGLASDLRSSASSEGCEEELTVVGSTELLALLNEINRLKALNEAEKSGPFVAQVAGLSIWDFDQVDGTPYKECERPSEGFLDSHTTLMNLIEQARRIQEGK